MAISYERQRQMVLKEYNFNNSNNVNDNEKTTEENTLNIKLFLSEYIGGTNIVNGTKDKTVIEKTILMDLLSKHTNPNVMINMLEYLIRLKRARLSEGQTSNVRKTTILQLMMCEEYIAVAQRKKKQQEDLRQTKDVDYYGKAYGLIHECIKIFKNDGWRELFTRSLRVAIACTRGREKYHHEYINHCLDLLLPYNNLNEDERIKLQQSIFEKANDTTIEYKMNHEQNQIFSPLLLQFNVQFLQNCVFVKDTGNLIFSVQSKFPQEIAFTNIDLVLKKSSSKNSKNSKNSLSKYYDDDHHAFDETVICRLTSGNESNAIKDDVMKSNIIELKNQHLSFRPNETKLFAFSIVENKLPAGDVVISGKSISCKTKYGISLTYVYGKHENKFQVKPSPGGTSAKVKNNKRNYIFRNKNVDRIDYEELVLKNNNDDLQVGVFSLFQPKAHVHRKTDDAESASIDPATLSSRAFKSLSIKKPESGLMVSKKNDAPILIGEWHPVHFTLSILEDTLPEDIPSNIVTHMSLNANDNDAVNLNIKTKCFLVVKNDADKDNGQKIFKLLDKNHSNHGRDDSIDNKNGTGEIENDECNFSVSIGSNKSNLYELIVYVCITTVDGNNFYSNINVDSVLHLTLNIEHTSTRCINVLSTVRKYVLKLENPINMDMSIYIFFLFIIIYIHLIMLW